MERLLGNRTSPAARAILEKSVAFLPVGAIEPHGPHLPLETDVLISSEAARRAAALVPRAFAAPAIPYSVTEFARDFPGAVSIPSATVTAYVRDVARGLLRAGASRVVLVTLHFEPAHREALRAATEERIVLADLTRRAAAQRIGGEFATGSCHAGSFETSLVLAIRPDLVDRAAMAALPELAVPLPAKMAAGASSFLECGMTQAYCGSPASASAEEGERLYGRIAEIVAESALTEEPPR